MNWKFNYWTVIVVLMAGGFIFSCMDNDPQSAAKQTWRKQITQIDKNVEKVLSIMEAKENCNDLPDTISVATAGARILAYRVAMGAYGKELAKKNIKVPVNFSNGYMKLPKCETLKIFENDPDGEVYLYLTLEAVPKQPDEQMLSVVFSNELLMEKDGNIDVKAGGRATVFDFVRPCPPSCGSGNGEAK